MQIMGAAAVAKSGGPTCALYLGRKDAKAADKHVSNLPSPCADTYAFNSSAGATSLYTTFGEGPAGHARIESMHAVKQPQRLACLSS